MTFDPTPRQNCRHGSPMGRRGSGTVAHVNGERLYLRRVYLDSGGYDSGGAYWGRGQLLWAWGSIEGDRRGYLRAGCREAAKAELREEAPDVRFFR